MSKAKEVQKAKYSFYGKLTDAFSKVVTTLLKWGFAYLMVRDLAGKLTLADIKVLIGIDTEKLGGLDPVSSLALKAGITVGVLGFLCGVAGIIYGYRQKKLKEVAISRTGSRIKQLEARVDPNRSSSNLTHTGNTRKEDL